MLKTVLIIFLRNEACLGGVRLSHISYYTPNFKFQKINGNYLRKIQCVTNCAKDTIYNDRRSMLYTAGGLGCCKPPAGPGQSPGGVQGLKVPGKSGDIALIALYYQK